tara:strand:+ start:8765 stop:9022 length:258 start_codon:yes stop_codon:yes gene_type:complete
MKTAIRKIGNSSGAIIPSTILKKLNLVEGDIIEITDDGKRIVIEPKQERPKYSLDELIQACDEKAEIPAELLDWDSAEPVGQELL